MLLAWQNTTNTLPIIFLLGIECLHPLLKFAIEFFFLFTYTIPYMFMPLLLCLWNILHVFVPVITSSFNSIGVISSCEFLKWWWCQCVGFFWVFIPFVLYIFFFLEKTFLLQSYKYILLWFVSIAGLDSFFSTLKN